MNLFQDLMTSVMKNKKVIMRATAKLDNVPSADESESVLADKQPRRNSSKFLRNSSIFADSQIFLRNSFMMKKADKNAIKSDTIKVKSDDPFARLAFMSRLDSRTLDVLDAQVFVQQFYECRIASLERYLSFCVMFHAMAKACHLPLLCHGWDMARSQSNLRVATTASPVTAAGDEHSAMSTEQMLSVRRVGKIIRGFKVNF